MKIISVVGARPNFMKVAPIYRAFRESKYADVGLTHKICHTGQHYDENMSKVFFQDLALPTPDFYLGVGNGSHAVQTAKVMIEFEKVLLREQPDLVLVVGDVNSTVACSLAAVKLGIGVAHVESGLRSFDRTMPEEINRILTDAIAHYLFVTEHSGLHNLKREGIDDEKIFFTGNVMIDSLIFYLPRAAKSNIFCELNVNKAEYCLVTLHRPSNVDNQRRLAELLNFLNELAKDKRVIFPVHPRTRNNIDLFKLHDKLDSDVLLIDPLGYIDFLALLEKAFLVITDSGGIQEETTFLDVPCLTLRSSTERPVTVEMGTNYLVGEQINDAKKYFYQILHGETKQGQIPELWDGRTAERIAEIIAGNLL
ncbi:MAG TPA: UDP-N-acetylglucosamine 2-epimerase (non-hydrolyzing) [bacterium]|nr:UDP-N-acetylglucosamine 2-epimerase (non-hydrolyzing) [bacterium]